MVAKSDNSAVQTLFRIGGGAAGMAARLGQWQIAGVRVDRSELECSMAAAGVKPTPPVSEWRPGILDELTAKIPPVERRQAMRRFMADPRDTATPDGTVLLLMRAFRGELLSASLTKRLAEMMEATTTGSARLKGLLPAGTVVAHKTGTSATAMNLNGATNDVGVITLPKSGQAAIAVYVKGSTGDLAAREKIIARVARSVFDAWS
jgi:beta-lactamase class A